MQIMSVKAMGGKTAKRYHVHLYLDAEGIETDMPLYSKELRRYNIIEGTEVPDAIYYEITDNILRTRIITRCEYLLNMKAYTEHELKEKLREGYYPENLIDFAIQKMKAYHFLDDFDYAQRYVELNKNRKSQRMIALELKNKGIDQKLIEQVTEELSDNQLYTLDKMVSKRCIGKNINDPKEWNRQLRYFLGKGFNYEEISVILSRMKENEEG